ncbi:hypothetical protein LCGC14_0692930 [marine sediment metagenome]|uniref:Uncharacterized protein n=1 Tax=marine sediment metagenome TaxID=412755 RepID=A0A0F9T676_9ZZZZ
MQELTDVKEFIRAMVRPMLALTGWLAILAMVWTGRPVPDQLWLAAVTFTGFYFGTRGASPPAVGPGGPPPAV